MLSKNGDINLSYGNLIVVPIGASVSATYSKTCVKRPPLKKRKLVFKTNNRLMPVKSIA